ncbi:two-component sensor histidine kinase, partial [Vibrio vulnificus]|nr:two-component sensor histidine kinase [Vibrio vulnificus]
TLSLAVEDLLQIPKEQWQSYLADVNTKLPIKINLMTDEQLSDVAIQATSDSPNNIVSYINQNGELELLALVEQGLWLHVKDN